MNETFQRNAMLFGQENVDRLCNMSVAVFGVGGVGGYVVEVLARSGVGHITLIDSDCVAQSNINRQIIALSSTVGRPKVLVAANRIHDINPDCTVTPVQMFYLPETASKFNFNDYDYVVDAVDTVSAKLSIICEAKRCNTRIISAMGAGNKTDPTAFRVADIFETTVDPLARVMRTELRKRGIDSLKVVYSTEPPKKPVFEIAPDEGSSRRSTPASCAFVPSAEGLIIGGEVVKELMQL